ncbi:MAG: TIGR00725 family protein [Chlorobi bacterium]|nr:TIGR00725 family protein [Chlorobiota bacterium]
MFKIGIIGPGESLCSTDLYRFGEVLGKKLGLLEQVVVCGGKGGFMEAVCKGVKSSPATFAGQTIGILPEDTSAFANSYIDVAIPTGVGVARNIIIINTADIIIGAGGGAGTLSELAFAWQKGKTVLCITGFGGWTEKLAGKEIDTRNKNLLIEVRTPEEIVEQTEIFRYKTH